MSSKRLSLALLALVLAVLLIAGTGPTAYAVTGDLVITGVIDGPLTGGIPKAIELYAVNDIPDLSIYGLGAANNGGGTDGVEFTFPADSVTAGTFIYVATESTAFTNFFGFAPTYTDGLAPNVNGDDAIELFQSGVVVDVFGDINVDGTGQPWEYMDGWAYRVSDTGQDGSTFVLANWTFSGPNALDGETSNATAVTPFPAGTYTTGGGGGTVVEPRINEFVFNHTGSDTGAFVEVAGTPNADYSAYTVLEIEGDSSGAGTIDAVLPVGTTNAAGYWTNPEDMENGTVTVLLVEGFTGAAGDDIDADNDGVIDNAPWTAVIDSVGVYDGGASDHNYGDTTLAASFDGGIFTVGGASRIPDGTDTDTPADWVRNDFSGLGLPGLVGSIDAGEAVNTPGQANAVVPAFTPIATIQETTDPTGDSPLVGTVVTTVGVVTGVFDNGDRVFIQDGSGPWSGIFLFRSGSMSVGDVVAITGDVEEFFGLTQFAFDSTTVLASGAGLPDPEPLATAVIGDEQWESVLVRASNVTVTNPALGFGEWSISDGSGDVVVDDLGFYAYAPVLGDSLEFVQGPLYYSFGAFKIEPRGDADISDLFICGDPFTPIYDIQGSGAASPLAGTAVQVEGVVVGDFQENDGDYTDLDGFYIQDPVGDGDPATSDGIFVYAPGAMDVMAGDAVRVSGTVSEFFDMTELTNVSAILNCGTGTVAPTAVTLPTDLEPFEGMLVTMDQPLYISEFFNFDRFGEIVLSTSRQYQPTATFEPGSPEAAALAAENAANRITLDDGRTASNPDPAIHPNGGVFDLTNLFRGGDMVTNVTGVVDYRFSLYRIQPTMGADVTPMNPRTAAPEDVGGSIQVASFNVLNYFTTIDTGAAVCGPNGNLGCRGADTAEEFARQRAKIISAISAMDADVVGLIEIENHADDTAVIDLVAGLNDAMGAGTYDYIATGPIGEDAIKVALIYKPASVTPVGSYAILDSSVDARFIDTKNRPALAQTFYDRFTGGTFTVVVNHLKSKGSPCDDVGDPNTGDGSGNCNLTRTMAAQALVDWLASDPTGSGDTDFLIIGDLNSYDKEDPIDAILAGADDVAGSSDDYTDLLFHFIGEDAYSYVFNGQLGYLDHGLANAALMPQVTGATVWHINADEPDLIDYDMSFKKDAQDAIYAPDAYRASDHDPVIIGLQLEPEGPIVNGDGCYVLGLPDTPYIYAVNPVTLDSPGLRQIGNRLIFRGDFWLRKGGLPRDTCLEIHGTDGMDMIFSGFGNDLLFGYGDNDWLDGRSGDDTLVGGGDKDFFRGGAGFDTVLDFAPGERCSRVEVGCTP